MRMRWAGLVLAVLALVAAGAASANVGIDASYGEGGAVRVTPLVPPSPEGADRQYVEGMVASVDGSAYVLFRNEHCPGCTVRYYLSRYLADGSLDMAFGGSGLYALPEEGEGIPALAVDSAGRPLLAQSTQGAPERPGQISIRRLTPEGQLDTSFGASGVVTMGCGCEYNGTQLVAGPRGTITVSLPRMKFESGTIMTLIRLDGDGHFDSGFGKGGVSTFGLPGAESFSIAATTNRGGLYLAGRPMCCRSTFSTYVVRVSARGRLDSRFARASKRALTRVEQGAFSASVNGLVARPRGVVDLLGAADYSGGFDLRLKANGHPARRFGHNGLRELPLPVNSATRGAGGAIMAVSQENIRGVKSVMRILPGGNLDPAFGNRGIAAIAPALGDYGLSITHQRGRRALVLDRGLQECRGFCQATPKLIRFIEPRRHRKRR